MKIPFLISIPLAFLASVISVPAEVRLITGDASNAPHKSSSKVMDISSDGDLVLFESSVPVPPNGPSPGITQSGLYLRTLSKNTLELVSGTAPISPIAATMSDDGRYFTWSRSVQGSGQHVFWRDRLTDTTRQISLGATMDSYNPVISADGRYVAFLTGDRNLVPDAGKLPAVNRGMVLLYDSQASGKGLSIVSLKADGTGLTTGVGPANAGAAGEFDFSRDGRYVVYSTDSTGVLPDSPTSGFYSVYRRSLADGSVIMMSRNPTGAVPSGSFTSPRISRNGQRVAFAGSFVAFIDPSKKFMDSVPAHIGAEIYVKDASGTAWRVTTPETGGVGGPVMDGTMSGRIAIDGDGDVVAFPSTSKNLVIENTDAPLAENNTHDIFRSDLPPGGGACVVTLISKSPRLAGNVDFTGGPVLPGTGAYVAFNTYQVEEMLGLPDANFPLDHGIAVGTFPAMQIQDAYTLWAASLPAGKRGFKDEPAGDGIANLLKFLVGMEPMATNPSLLPISGLQTGTSLGLSGDFSLYLTFQVRVRRNLPQGITWKVVCHEDLAALSGSTSSGIQVGSPNPDAEFDVYQFRFPSSVSTSPRGFMRLEVTGS
jgi:hypothetical protein